MFEEYFKTRTHLSSNDIAIRCSSETVNNQTPSLFLSLLGTLQKYEDTKGWSEAERVKTLQ